MSNFKDLFSSGSKPEPAVKPEQGQRWDIFGSQQPPAKPNQNVATFTCPFAGEDRLEAALKRVGNVVSKIAKHQDDLNLTVIGLVREWNDTTAVFRNVLAEIEAIDRRVELLKTPAKAGWFSRPAPTEDPSRVLDDLQAFLKKTDLNIDPFLIQKIGEALTMSTGNERGAANSVAELGKFSPDPSSAEGDLWARLMERAEALRSICRMTCSQLDNMNKTLESHFNELKVVRGVTVPVLVMQLTSYIQQPQGNRS